MKIPNTYHEKPNFYFFNQNTVINDKKTQVLFNRYSNDSNEILTNFRTWKQAYTHRHTKQINHTFVFVHCYRIIKKATEINIKLWRYMYYYKYYKSMLMVKNVT